jgi:pimeloyl-ACP methyl ester carboxylesterase
MNALDTMMPPLHRANVNGLNLAYYDTGVGEGVPIVFCHGFPELAFSWRHQLAACAKAGIRAIAPDQRGYGLTSGPRAVEDYDMVHLTGDMVGLLDHLKIDKAVFCGHDWGGIIVWQMGLMHPDRCAGIIGVNTPFMPRAPIDPIEIMRARMGEMMYIVHFQKPQEADAVLGHDARRTMDFFMRRPIVDGAAPQAVLSTQDAPQGMATERKEGDPPLFALVPALQAWDQASDPREKFLSPTEFDAFAETFQKTGFTGGINWYRNFTRNWQNSAHLPTKVDLPSMMIMAELDAVLPPSAADGMEAFVPDLDRVLIPGSGHWTQQEKPDEVNSAILEWMSRRFPK